MSGTEEDFGGLAPEEYARVLEILGRRPNEVELGIFAAMWSEHCSYKSSKKWLRTLPTEGPLVLQGPGENAGAVDIGGVVKVGRNRLQAGKEGNGEKRQAAPDIDQNHRGHRQAWIAQP